MAVPIIDLFAGPGGLGEGFSKAKSVRFEIAVSIEKDGQAYETLRLRAAHRALARSGAASRTTWALWDSVLAKAPWNIAFELLASAGDELIAAACRAASKEAWNLELGNDNREVVTAGIRERLKPFMKGGKLPSNSVLIGGPPCQAYSIVGRSRNRGTKGYKAENDHRHFLYREYLHVINEFRPAVFVMENVKGILSSKVEERQLFESILQDLRRPDHATGSDSNLKYDLVALEEGSTGMYGFDPEAFIVSAEKHGVPQARHRVIICGIRRDISTRSGSVGRLQSAAAPSVREVIDDLPRVRPAISYRGKGKAWIDSFNDPLVGEALQELRDTDDADLAKVAARMERARDGMRRQKDPGSGADRVHLGTGAVPLALAHPRWYRDRSLGLLANHESRAHMPSDLVRYLFVSAFGEVKKKSPRLQDFPTCLLPSHRNVDPSKPEGAIFKDRFRVQVSGMHSMTVTSHIAKDGHAFIHYAPSQCRSLTVREAARLQTFPDSYVFLGNRTSQYTQVGNAVPPYLAMQIAEIVGDVLKRASAIADSNSKLASCTSLAKTS